MQFLAMIASFIFGRMKTNHPGGGLRETIRETVNDMFEDIVLKGRKPTILIMAGIGAVLFFCGGLFITVLEGTTQYDRVGYVTLTSTLGAGIALFLLAAAGFTYVFAFAWPGAGKQSERERVQAHQHSHAHPASSLEQALTALVLDFVKEREVRRERETQGMGPVPPRTKTEHPNPSAPIH